MFTGSLIQSQNGHLEAQSDKYVSWLSAFTPEKGNALVLGSGSAFQLERNLAKKQANILSVDVFDSSMVPIGAQHELLTLNIDGAQLLQAPERFRNFMSRPVDCIYCIEVLEHLESPHAFLSTLASMTEKKTRVVLAVPNSASWFGVYSVILGRTPYTLESSDLDATIGGGWLARRNSPERRVIGHVRFHCKRSLVDMCRNVGFQVIEVLGDGRVGPNWLYRRIPRFAPRVTLLVEKI